MTITLNFSKDDAYIEEYIEKNHIDTSDMTVDQFLELLKNAKASL